MPNTILVVDDEKSVRESLKLILEEHYQVLLSDNGQDALEKLLSEKVDLMLLDIRMPGISGLNVLKQVENIARDVEVIIISADQQAGTAIDALNLGAYHYITKPFNAEELLTLIRTLLEKKSLVRENILLRSKISKATSLGEVIGHTEEMQKVIQEIARSIRNEDTVMLSGESGTEKELIAYTIHQQSARGGAGFVTVQCAQRSSFQLEQELFGHEKETGNNTYEKHSGALEEASAGVLFLNEIGSLSPALQEKLLNALQHKQFLRINGKYDIPLNIRLICASSLSLRRLVSQGRFNEELYHYINVLPLDIPSLRQRKKDIPLLVDAMLQRYNRELGCNVENVSEEALLVLSAYDWPGNVTELECLMEQLISQTRTGTIETARFPLEMITAGWQFLKDKRTFFLENLTRDFQRSYARKVLQENQGNQLLTALQLKLEPAVLQTLLG